MIICYTVPEIWHVMDVIVIFRFGLCLGYSHFEQNFIKMKKTPEDTIILHSVPKIMIR